MRITGGDNARSANQTTRATRGRAINLAVFLHPALAVASRTSMPTAAVGQSVWVYDEVAAYQIATVAVPQFGDGNDATVKTADGKTLTTSIIGQVRDWRSKSIHHRAVWLLEPRIRSLSCVQYDPVDEEQQDLVQMTNVDRPNILNTLRARHKAGATPYTSVGGIIISVNPYRWMDIYGTAVMREHYESFGTKELAPHVFAIAADAYKSLCVHGHSQTIVTSGESGAGKTENSKQVFRFLAEIAGVQAGGGGEGGVRMDELLIHSNPVLEAFGNAKTLRNDNSSRFGKLVTVLFDGSGKIVGANNKNYLLEKPRVSAPPSDERNYHAFYQLLSGLSAPDKSRRRLKSVGEHRLLRSSCTSVAGLDDAAEWNATLAAMRALGFASEEIECIADVVAALLHLGDVEVVADKSASVHGDELAKLDGGIVSLQPVSELLGVDNGAFAAALTSIKVRETVNTMTVDAARKNRDAVVAAMYSRLFDRIVQRINGAGGGADDDSCMSIGVLDIFGFEIFEVNSFEQLCINFANEKLQRNFTMTTFHEEEGLYTSEGIAFEHIDYIDNTPVLELLDCVPPKGSAKKRGLIQLLDSEVQLLPRSTDKTFLDKLNSDYGTAPGQKTGGHPSYSVDFRTPDLFTIRHYAGDVAYTLHGFLEKSVENVAIGLIMALKTSSKPLISSLFTLPSARRSMQDLNEGSSRKPSVGLKFSKQLARLIETIEATQAHFIRCVKPNALKSPTAFDAKLTLEQLKYSGVFEAVAIRKSGYPFRMSHKQFAYRYSCVLPNADAAKLSLNDAQIRSTVEAMITKHLPSSEALLTAAATLAVASGAEAPRVVELAGARVGKTSVFYRAAENRALELAREACILPRLALVARLGRGAICRGAKRRLKAAKVELAAATKALELTRLEAALAGALTPQRGFHRGGALEFALHVPNIAEVTSLVSDLREEQRVEPALAALVASDSLSGATYDAMHRELKVAAVLREKLGRDVPSFAAAECVVGMTDGVNEHDRERLQTALAMAEKLGLASRLTTAIDKANTEIHRLEGGLALEQTLRAELGEHRSLYMGNHTWDHAPIATDGLQKALDAGVKHPLESKQGLALISEAKISLELRPLIKTEAWVGLLGVLRRLPADVEQTTEVRNAWSELTDRSEVLVIALRAALASGRSVRIGEAKWDHASLNTTAVSAAKAAVEAFPYKPDAATSLAEEAAIIIAVRTALKASDWASAASWSGLVTVLEGVPQSHREAEEVQDAWKELFEVRAMLERAVSKALDSGRSVKRFTTAVAIGWAHDEMVTEPLSKAVAALDAFPRASDAGAGLSKQAHRAVAVREALIAAMWPAVGVVRSHTAATWEVVAGVVEKLGDLPGGAAAGHTHDEVVAARAELNDARTHYESVVRTEMGRGRASRSGTSQHVDASTWNHSGLSAEALVNAIDELLEFGRPKASTEQVLAPAKLVVELRSKLQDALWDAPASWAGVANFLEGIDPQAAEHEELIAAKAELADRRRFGEAALAAGLSSGRSRRTPGSRKWTHETIEVVTTTSALTALRAFPRISDEGHALALRADTILPIREALLAVVPEDAATWAGAWVVLEGVPSELRDEEEVAFAWEEVLEARDATEAALKATLAMGRSAKTRDAPLAKYSGGADAGLGLRRTLTKRYSTATMSAVTAPSISGDGGAWSHGQLSTDALAAALVQVRAFPKVSEGGASLSQLGDAIVELRTALASAAWGVDLSSSDDARAGWARLSRWLEDAASGAYAREEEVLAACQELADKRVSLEAKAKAAVDERRSVPPANGIGAWSHEQLGTAGMTHAYHELNAFPRASESGKALGELLIVMISLREALMVAEWSPATASWTALADALDETGTLALGASEPVLQVRTEFEARRAATEVAVQLALDTGASRPLPGGLWAHDGIVVEPLVEAQRELTAFPRVSEEGHRLSALASLAVGLRKALLVTDTSKAASWSELATVIDHSAAEAEAADFGEFNDAVAEFNAARALFEDAVSSALSTNRSVKVNGVWSHADLGTSLLASAHMQLSAFPRKSDAGRTLEAHALGVLAIRAALAQCEWTSAASWLALATALDAVQADIATLEEIVGARTELVDKREDTMAAVRKEMGRGASVHRAGSAGWDHAGMSTTALDAAIDECAAFPRRTAESSKLIDGAKVISKLRTALSGAEVGESSSWRAVTTFLGGHADHDDLAELKEAWQELREARDNAESLVIAALKTGCSRSAGGAKPWNHSSLDAKTLQTVAAELDAFPRVAAAMPAATATLTRRHSMVKRRESMSRVTESANTLVTSAGTIVQLRELLSANSWPQVHAFIETSDHGAKLHELCAEEMRHAGVEMQDHLAHLEASMRAALEQHRSKRVASGSAWDHKDLSVGELNEASATLRAFPLQSTTAVGLVRLGELVATVREKLLAQSWGELCALLESVSDAVLLQNDEVRAATLEVEEMRTRVIGDLSDAMSAGRSLKVVGKKVNVFVDKTYFLPIAWDHSGLSGGLAGLKAAVNAVGAFPGVSDKPEVGPMLTLATLLLRLRTLIAAEQWSELLDALDAISLPSHLTHDEVLMARQEYLTVELERAAHALDQKALKKALAMATGAGMLPVEKPVYRALGVFIDPPEYILNLRPPSSDGALHEVMPAADGRIVLTVKVRGATSLQWNKNGIALKEGADGGRISGVAAEVLTFSRTLGRDENQKLQCVAKNKFGVVKSHEVKIRLVKSEKSTSDAAPAAPPAAVATTSSPFISEPPAPMLGSTAAEELPDSDSDEEELLSPRSRNAVVSLVAPVEVSGKL